MRLAEWCFVLLTGFFLCSCVTPVLQRSVMERGERNPDLAELLANPSRHMGQLFVFGGIIASTKVTRDGSLLEAVYVPVDQYGDLAGAPTPSRRFLALYREGVLDPVIYSPGRRVTLAGTFMETRPGKLGEMEYTFPVFQVTEVYLWPKEPKVYYYVSPPYYSPYPWYRPWY